jgi:hypothetical protein
LHVNTQIQPNRNNTYGFRLKFHMPPGRTFKGVHPRRRIYLDGIDGKIYLIKFPQQKRNRFGARLRFAFSGVGFPTHNAALECGRRLKVALGLLAVERQFGLDAGNDRATSQISQAIKNVLAQQHAAQLRDDVHGLDVYAEQPPVTRFAIEAYASSSYVIDNYEQRLRALYGANHALTPKQQLALDLYNLAHFEGTPKTRFLTLVTVVEILASRKAHSDTAKALLAQLSATVRASSLSAQERTALLNGLANLKQESIGEACRTFVLRHAASADAKFFSNCYKARSELVHDGTTTRQEAVNPSALDTLVSRLFVASIGEA